MLTLHRGYSEAYGDFNRLTRFVIENNRAVRTYSTWCLGRLVDWRYSPFPPTRLASSFCSDNAHLWFDGFGELAGFVISECGDAEFAIITAEGYRFLFEEMLRWVLAEWASRGPDFSVETTAAQELEARALEAAGFRNIATFRTEWFDLTRPLPAPEPLEAGFRIVDMGTYPDYRGQRIMRSEAFGGETGLTDDYLDRHMEVLAGYLRNPMYHAPTDLCVVGEDGTVVAGCEALIDARNLEADIERVATHSAYRRRGFARAAIRECLLRLQAIGWRARRSPVTARARSRSTRRWARSKKLCIWKTGETAQS
jgi:GNAT superfamily N-acetyltransferase